MDFLNAGLGRTSGARALTATAAVANIPGGEGEQLLIYNKGPNAAAIVTYSSADAAPSVAVMPTDNAAPNGLGGILPPGSFGSVTIGSADRMSGICASTETATILYSRVKGG